MNALDTYTKWLPGKLLSNSAEYAQRSERLLTGDYSRELTPHKRDTWNRMQQLKTHETPDHREVTQLLADFATDFFGDFVVVNLLMGQQQLPHRDVTRGVAKDISELEEWLMFGMLDYDPIEELAMPYDDTTFAENILDIKAGLIGIAGDKKLHPTNPIIGNTTQLMCHAGVKAIHCYGAYANEYGQLYLPPPLHIA